MRPVFQEAHKALETGRDGLVCRRAQIALHIRKPDVEQSTWWIARKPGGLGKVLNRCHMLLHRLGAHPFTAQVFPERLDHPGIAREHGCAHLLRIRGVAGWPERSDDSLALLSVAKLGVQHAHVPGHYVAGVPSYPPID